VAIGGNLVEHIPLEVGLTPNLDAAGEA
jgi:hypothetical protein